MKRILMIFVAMVVAGCTISQTERLELSKERLLKIDRSSMNVDFNQPIHIDCCISEDIGRYLDFYAKTDFVAGISASSPNPLSERSFRFINEHVSNSPTVKSGIALLKRNISIDGNDIDDICIMTESCRGSCYGRNVVFGIESANGNTKSESDSDNINIEMYIPELINIIWPSVTSEDEAYPLCYYDGLHVKWNSDPRNLEGILIVVEWTGLIAYGNHYPDAYVRCVQKVDDTGEAVLDNAMFEAIPDTAICYLTLLRGNIENIVTEDSVSYKLVGESHQELQFVLIKNIRDKVS